MAMILAILICADVHTEAANLAKKAMPPERYHQMMAALTGSMAPMRQTMSDADRQKTDKMMTAIQGAITYEEMVGFQADWYAAHFTLDELQHLSRIYDEPVLQKMQALAPRMLTEMMPKMQALMAPRIQKIVNEERAKPPPPK
jgi:hypothetical protein